MTAPDTQPAPYLETLEMLTRLVAQPTVSAESNLALIALAEAHLQACGYQTHRLPDPTGRKSGLLAARGSTTGGVMLSAHSDVVPVTGQSWTRPPFALTREGERLYGRGTTDMKGFLASMLSAASRAAAKDVPLMLCISYDEETGCTGIRDMLPGIAALGWRPDLCIIGEPTSMIPATGHKGKAAFHARFTGQAGHSALAPHYVNALHIAADFIQLLREIQAQFLREGARDPGYDLPCSTLHAGILQGGTALNIVPDKALLEFELRHLPGESAESLLQALRPRVAELLRPYRALSPGADVEILVTNSYPGLDSAASDPAVARLMDLTGAKRTTKVAYGTEAGYFAGLGWTALVCGPGDMAAQGHKADEYLEISQLGACDQFMDQLIAELSAQDPG